MVHIRSATIEDAVSLVEIYRPYVESTPVSFETLVPDSEEFKRRITNICARWAWLVSEVDGTVAGYAYGSSYRPREAYRYSVETTAYVSVEYQRRGIAGALYNALFGSLAEKGYANAYAGIALPNDASIGFHERLGFESIGIFPNVGFKFDRWHDVAWFYRPLKLEPARTANTFDGPAR